MPMIKSTEGICMGTVVNRKELVEKLAKEQYARCMLPPRRIPGWQEALSTADVIPVVLVPILESLSFPSLLSGTLLIHDGNMDRIKAETLQVWHDASQFWVQLQGGTVRCQALDLMNSVCVQAVC